MASKHARKREARALRVVLIMCNPYFRPNITVLVVIVRKNNDTFLLNYLRSGDESVGSERRTGGRKVAGSSPDTHVRHTSPLRENVLFQGHLSVLILISVSVAPP